MRWLVDEVSRVTDEIKQYSSARIHEGDLEVDTLDREILRNVIRKRELEIINGLLLSAKPSMILDFGAGSGWLSHYLLGRGYKSVGIDISRKLLHEGKERDQCLELVASDAHLLPFLDNSFDVVICVGILHHLRLEALKEISRVTKRHLLLMEPSRFNFFSHVGRTLFPTSLHTEGEAPLDPRIVVRYLKRIGVEIAQTEYLFSIAFPIARIFRVLQSGCPPWFSRLLLLFERAVERIPFVRDLNSTIVILGEQE
jgi:SAM-dependent methyltransferase